MCWGAVEKTLSDFALNSPIAVEAVGTVFIRVDLGDSTDQGRADPRGKKGESLSSISDFPDRRGRT